MGWVGLGPDFLKNVFGGLGWVGLGPEINIAGAADG